MIGKVDLVMWAKNGGSFLPKVLGRIEEVIPHEKIEQKILVDDHSQTTLLKSPKTSTGACFQILLQVFHPEQMKR